MVLRGARWMPFVFSLLVLVASAAGCTSVLGDFDVIPGGEDGGLDASLGDHDANGGSDVAANPDTNPPGTDAGSDTNAPGDDGGQDVQVTCPSTQKACGGSCVPKDSVDYGCADPTSCSPCDFKNAVGVCVGGACALDHCLNGYQDCNNSGADGCEAYTAGDPNNCGQCKKACNATNGTPTCAGGTCTTIVCNDGYADCNNDPKDGCEIHIGGDTSNCGTCGYVCGTANGTPSCGVVAVDGGAPDAGPAVAQCQFACTKPYAHCPASADKNGCDVDTDTDDKNCGKCGNSCGLGQHCVKGACTCDSTTCPSGCCDANQNCVTATDGACGKSGAACAACAAGQECNATTGACVCDAASCPNGCCDANGQCVNTASNTACGKGGKACAACGAGTACSTDGTTCTCTAASCPNGCCNGNTCVATGSQSPTQCGNNGDVCGTCASGQLCTNGTCGCGGVSCSGCCNASSQCVGGTTNAACGSSGAACSACPANQECNAQGKCVCDANTCPSGCCDGSGNCVTSEASAACGKGGVACAACGSGQECSASTGKCVCDATSCPSGCCNGNVCVPYANETQAACGTAGAQCGACAQGQQCNAAGKCVCNATSCPNGCCDGNGQCQASTSSTCGTGGAACATCNAGQECSGGSCKCDATSCGHGCCAGNQCVTAESNAQCGSSGAACVACPSGTECNGVSCVCDATSCPNGCCNGNTCVPWASETNAACGTSGSKCSACGTGTECSSQTHVCTCDATSCPNGCCNGLTCVPYASETSSQCGAAGAACGICPSGQACNTLTGKCGCSATSCPNGCCAADGTCQSPTSANCGTGGAACVTCAGTQSCSSGTCACDVTKCSGCCSGATCNAGTSSSACGSNAVCAACAAGQECASSGGKYACTCDGTSCPNGCCDASGKCQTSGASTCGVGGAACAACSGATPYCYNGTCDPTFTLNVNKVGTAAPLGTVSSTDGVVSCGKTCSGVYKPGSTVVLNATSAKGTAFLGWAGACTGNGSCTVTMGANATVTANFVSIVPTAWDPTWSIAGASYSNANLSVTSTTASSHVNVRTLDGKSSGRWYWELTATAGAGTATNNGGIGILESVMPNNASYIGAVASGMSFGYEDGRMYASWANTTFPNGVVGPIAGAITKGSVYSFALDMDKGNLWIAVDGAWFFGGDPAAGGTPAMQGIAGTVYPGVTFYDTVNAFTANFGGGGGAQNGFVYPPPPGFNPGFYNIPTTWDPSWSVPGVTYTNGNLSISGNSAGTKNVRTVASETKTGRFYWEITATGGVATSNGGGLGLLESAMPNNASWIGSVASGMSFGYAGGTYFMTWAGASLQGGTAAPSTAAVAAGNVYMFALDLSNSALYCGMNGAWFNNGDVTNVKTAAVLGLGGTVFPGVTLYANTADSYTANFGASPFKYPPPLGFAAGFY